MISVMMRKLSYDPVDERLWEIQRELSLGGATCVACGSELIVSACVWRGGPLAVIRCDNPECDHITDDMDLFPPNEAETHY